MSMTLRPYKGVRFAPNFCIPTPSHPPDIPPSKFSLSKDGPGYAGGHLLLFSQFLCVPTLTEDRNHRGSVQARFICHKAVFSFFARDRCVIPRFSSKDLRLLAKVFLSYMTIPPEKVCLPILQYLF